MSIATHAALLAVGVFMVARLPEAGRTPATPVSFDPTTITWLDRPGVSQGGGGGGDRNPAPPGRIELPGRDKITVPAARPRSFETSKAADEEPRPPQIEIPAVAVAAGVQEAPGALTGLPSLSQGPGDGGGVGSGLGPGMGPGQGPGLGLGWGGNTGGGPARSGTNGVNSPRLLVEVKPNYTADAMRARIEGVVTLEAVVMPDGTVGAVRLTRSLDSTFGLDQEAIRTVKKWRFRPGTRMGQPIPVLVDVEMTFTLH